MDQETTPSFLHFRLPDSALVTRTMAEVAERGQRIVTDFLKRQAESDATPDPLNIGGAFFEMTTRLMANPARPMQAQLGFWQDYLTWTLALSGGRMLMHPSA
jgi:polyhydroxyalkanoate synthase subunit PhaC